MRTEIEKDYLLRAIDTFSERFIIISADYTLLATNRAANGHPTEKIVGQKCYAVFYDRSAPCQNCPAADVLATGNPVLAPGSYQHDQTRSELRCRYFHPLADGSARDALAVLDFDIPANGKLDEALKQSNAFLKNLILSAIDGVIAADKTGRILIFNQASSKISGYSIDEALSMLNIRDIYPGNGAREVMRRLRSEKYGGKGKLKSYQVNVRSKTGEEIPISLNAAIVYEKDREIATIGFFHDLRETLRMKQELENTQIQLLQAEKMTSLGKLAAGVAHQLNNPLGGIILYAQLMLEEYELDKAVLEDLNRILKDAKRCRDTVRELLEFTRQTRHLMQPHDINQAISRTLFLVENHTIFQNIQIIKHLAPALPLLSVDIQQINHMFMNIIFNAAQAMDGSGTLTLKTYLLPDKERIAIDISDTGPGISKEHLPHIFEPFFTTKDEGKGTGLGLSLVYGIVQNHGGTIKAATGIGSGTTFTVELPIDPVKHKENGHEK